MHETRVCTVCNMFDQARRMRLCNIFVTMLCNSASFIVVRSTIELSAKHKIKSAQKINGKIQNQFSAAAQKVHKILSRQRNISPGSYYEPGLKLLPSVPVRNTNRD